MRILTENAVNTYLDDAVLREERDDRAEDLITIVRAFISDLPMEPRYDAKSLRQITRNIIRMYLGEGPTQKERVRRADGLIGVIKVYMRRELR